MTFSAALFRTGSMLDQLLRMVDKHWTDGRPSLNELVKSSVNRIGVFKTHWKF